MDRIAVGIDFSAESDVALTHAIGLARQLDAPLALFHIYSPVASAYAGAAAHQVEAALQVQRDQARAIIAAKRDRARSAGVDARCDLIPGDPKRGLAEAAEAAGASLLVVGSRGRTGLQRFLMGSVAERAVRSSVIDTLVARSPEGGHYRRILVPLDLFDHSERTLSTAIRLASPAGAIDLLHAIEPVASVGLSQTLGLAMAAVEQETNKRGSELVERYRTRHPTLAFSAVHDTAANAIAKRLDGSDYDLVVMGSRGRGRVERWLLGSVAETTVRHAPCSVWVVKDGDASTHSVAD